MNIGTILINWNNATDTLECLASLKAGRRRPDKILLWDNHSSDDSCARIRKEHPDIEIVQSPRNVGFAEANNSGASLLLAAGASAVWILNNDTLVDKECLHEMARALETRRDTDIVTAKIMHADDPKTLWYAGGYVRPIFLDAIHYGAGEQDRGQYDKMVEVGFVSGCCLLTRAEPIVRYGLFNSAFFAYCEDMEWSLRMRENGVKMLYIPSAKIHHKISASIQKNDPTRGRCTPLQHYYETRNHLYVLRLHSRAGLPKLLGISRCAGRRMFYAGVNIILGRFDKSQAIFRGIRDGLGRRPEPSAPLRLP